MFKRTKSITSKGISGESYKAKHPQTEHGKYAESEGICIN